MPLPRIIVTVALAVALGLAGAGAAYAAGPERTTATFSVTEPEENFPCVEEGFSTLATFTVTRRSAVYSDAEGEPIREIRHVRFTGTLYSPDLSRSIPYAGTFVRTEDYRTGTLALTGLVRFTPGLAAGPRAAGRAVIDLATDTALLEAGRLPADYERDVCRYLAG